MKAAVFDIDGTLLDSVDLHAEAWVAAFRHFGVEADLGRVRSQIGKGGDELMPVFLSETQLRDQGETIEAYRSDLFKRDYRDRVKPFPGVRALFERLRADGTAVALASSGKRADVEHYQEVLGVADLVEAATSSDDAERSKPHPDIFQAALSRLDGVERGDVVVIGDTPYDAQAAGKAGLATVGVLCGGFPEADLRAAGCIAIYRSPQHLLEDFESSPLAKRKTSPG